VACSGKNRDPKNRRGGGREHKDYGQGCLEKAWNYVDYLESNLGGQKRMLGGDSAANVRTLRAGGSPAVP